jgi:hypothetical protein
MPQLLICSNHSWGGGGGVRVKFCIVKDDILAYALKSRVPDAAVAADVLAAAAIVLHL